MLAIIATDGRYSNGRWAYRVGVEGVIETYVTAPMPGDNLYAEAPFRKGQRIDLEASGLLKTGA